jgi:hypothetical protein
VRPVLYIGGIRRCASIEGFAITGKHRGRCLWNDCHSQFRHRPNPPLLFSLTSGRPLIPPPFETLSLLQGCIALNVTMAALRQDLPHSQHGR